MNVNAAFSSFCRFYPSLRFPVSTSIWKNGMRSTIVMHASSVCCRQLSLYSTNTPNGTYFPAIPHPPFLSSTQHFIQRLQHQPRAREHSVRSQRLRLIPAVLTHEILVRRHQKLDVLAENHRGLLEERDAVGARAAGVHAGIVVRAAMQAEK